MTVTTKNIFLAMTGDRPGTIRSDALMHRIKDVMLDAVMLAVNEERTNPGRRVPLRGDDSPKGEGL